MRPLFPKDYRNDVTLENLVMSVDQDCSPELTAMLGASLATSISDIPFDGPISTTQVGLIDGEFVFNPTAAQREVSDLALTVASTKEKVIMIEAGANEVPEDRMIEAIFAAHELNQKVIAFFDTIVAECGKPKHEYESCAIPEELFDAIKEIVPPAEMEQAVFTDEKQIREDNIRQITDLPISEKNCKKNDLKRSQTSGRTRYRSDQTSCSRSGSSSKSPWFCNVYKRTDPDLYGNDTGAFV